MRIKIGYRIKELSMMKLGLTQEEFAEMLDFDRTYLSRIESGKQNITIDTLAFICDKLQVSLAEFFESFVKIAN